MKNIIALLTILSIAGCQTTKHECPIIPQTDKVTINLRRINKHGMIADASEKDPKFEVAVRIYKENKIASAPMLTTPPNEWTNIDVALDIGTIDQTANVLIEDEIVSINCEPGIHLKVKVIPQNNDLVHLKGVYALSKVQNMSLMTQKEIFPFSIYCKLGEEIILHDIITKKIN